MAPRSVNRGASTDSEKATGRLRLTEGLAYGLTAGFSAVLAFVRAPLYTRWFEPAAYGDFILVSTAAGLLSSVVLAVFSNVLYRRYDAERRSGRLDVLLSTVIVGTAGSLVLVTVAVWFGSSLIGFSDPTVQVWIILLMTILVFQSLVSQVNRMEHQVGAFLVGKVVDPAWQLIAPLVFLAVGVAELAALAVVAITAGAGSLIVGMVWARKVLSSVRFRKANRTLLRANLKYGVPLVPLALAGWVIASSNRYVIQYYWGSEATGVFSMGYSLASGPISMIASVLVMTVGPVVWERANLRGGTEALHLVCRAATLFLGLAVPAALGLGLVSSQVIDLLFTSSYRESVSVIFPVALGAVFSGLYSFLVKPWELHEETRRIPLYVGFGAVVNLVTNLLLVPRFGIAGAAWGSLIAYGLVACVMIFDAWRLYAVWVVPGWRDGLAIAISVFLMGVAVLVLEGVLGHGILGLGGTIAVGAVVYGASVMVTGYVFKSSIANTLHKVVTQALRRVAVRTRAIRV